MSVRMPSETPDPLWADIAGLAAGNPLIVDWLPSRPVTRSHRTVRGRGDVVRHKGNTAMLLTSACKARLNGCLGEDWVWSGAKFETAVHLATNGWHDAMPIVDGLFSRLVAERTSSILPTVVRSDEPDGDVDVERWLEGDDECYLVRTEWGATISAKGSVIKFIFDPFVSCVFSTDQVLQRGCYLAALVYMFDRAGYSTEIVARMPTEGSKMQWLLDVDVKSQGEVLDLPRVLFWLAHPAAFRQIIIMMYRGYGRQDSIWSVDDKPQEPNAILAAPLVWGQHTDLDAWIRKITVDNNLVVEG